MDKILNILFTFNILLSLVNFVLLDNRILILIIFTGFIKLLYYLIRYPKKYYYFIICILVLSTMFLIKLLYLQELGFYREILLIISNVGIAIHINENKKAFKIISTIYILITMFLIYNIGLGIAPANISIYYSENIVNFIYLLFSILITILFYSKKEKIVLFPAILSTLVSLWTMGRAGIISSIIMLIGVIFIKYKDKLNIPLISFVLILLTIFNDKIIKYLMIIAEKILYRFGQRTTGIEGDPRVNILKAYIDELDLTKIIFGQDLNTHYYAGFTSLHNSFFDIHYSLGIGGLFIIILLVSLLIYFIINKQYLYFILLFVLLLRASTDRIIFGELYDFIWIYFIILYAQNKSKSRNIM